MRIHFAPSIALNIPAPWLGYCGDLEFPITDILITQVIPVTLVFLAICDAFCVLTHSFSLSYDSSSHLRLARNETDCYSIQIKIILILYYQRYLIENRKSYTHKFINVTIIVYNRKL